MSSEQLDELANQVELANSRLRFVAGKQATLALEADLLVDIVLLASAVSRCTNIFQEVTPTASLRLLRSIQESEATFASARSPLIDRFRILMKQITGALTREG